MVQTDHFNLNIAEGSDRYNHLTVDNPNYQAIDAQMFLNQTSGVQSATHLKSGTVHAITRAIPDAAMFRFTATADFTTGETFTVDTVQVTALLPNGTTLSTGAFKINSTVLCSLVGSLLTVYTIGAAENIDADTLDGHPAEYFGTATDVAAAQQTATSAGVVANGAAQSATAAINAVNSKTMQQLWTNDAPNSVFTAQTVAIDLSPFDAVLIDFSCANDPNVSMHTFAVIPKASAITEIPVGVAGGNVSGFRRLRITNAGIIFGNGAYWNTVTTTIETPTMGIPVAIYGIKF